MLDPDTLWREPTNTVVQYYLQDEEAREYAARVWMAERGNTYSFARSLEDHLRTYTVETSTGGWSVDVVLNKLLQQRLEQVDWRVVTQQLVPIMDGLGGPDAETEVWSPLSVVQIPGTDQGAYYRGVPGVPPERDVQEQQPGGASGLRQEFGPAAWLGQVE
jgi:hypothetical protein